MSRFGWASRGIERPLGVVMSQTRLRFDISKAAVRAEHPESRL